MQLDWNYAERYVDLSMPTYVPNMRSRFQHVLPNKPQRSPHCYTEPIYGKSTQLIAPLDTSAPLNDNGKKQVETIVGSSLNYGRAVDSTILPACSTISTQQAQPTQQTKADCGQLLDYLATHPNATI